MPELNPAKQRFIEAYFDELERKIDSLSVLGKLGYSDEALILCLVYIDGLAQQLCWPCPKAGVNFVTALSNYTSDTQLALIHPIQLLRALDGLAPAWAPIRDTIRNAVPTGSYELTTPDAFLASLGSALTPAQLASLKDEMWRGTIAAIAYYAMRIPAVHNLGASTQSFSQTTYEGLPVKSLTMPRLQRAATELAKLARSRSLEIGNWLGSQTAPQ